MKISNVSDVEAEPVTDPAADRVSIRLLIDERAGAPSFNMRHFRIEPGGHTPRHAHTHEHEVFILRGEGKLLSEKNESPFRQGDAVFVAPNEEHQFVNDGLEPLEFLCLVPQLPAAR